MGLTERHLLNDEGGAWKPIGGWPDKPNVSSYPQLTRKINEALYRTISSKFQGGNYYGRNQG